MAEATIMGGAQAYLARGMACMGVDVPGEGGGLRLKDLHLPPDTDRVIKAMIDYLETRSDVDTKKIGLQGISMGGYGVPRAASNEPRVAGAFMSSGSYDPGRGLFQYLPSFLEAVRGVVGDRAPWDEPKRRRGIRTREVSLVTLISHGAVNRGDTLVPSAVEFGCPRVPLTRSDVGFYH